MKGYLGNVAAGCGGVELIASLIGVNQGKIPAILNCTQPDPDLCADLVRGRPRATRNPIFVNSNVTPLGQVAAVVVRGGSAA